MSEYEDSTFNEIIKNEMGDYLPADTIAISELQVLAHSLAMQGRQTKYRSFCFATEIGLLSMSKHEDECDSLITVAVTNPKNSDDCIAEVVFDKTNSIKALQIDKERSEDAIAVLGLSMLEEGFNESERFAIMGLHHLFKASLQSKDDLETAVNTYGTYIASEANVAVDRLSFGQSIVYNYDYSVNEHTTLHVGMDVAVETDDANEKPEEQLIVNYIDTLLGNEYSMYKDSEGETTITVSKIGALDLQNDVLVYTDMSVGTVEFLKGILLNTILRDY